MPLTSQSSKQALHRGILPDSFTHALYRIAPYRGCAHGCKYCDGRAEKYFVEGDFESDIIVRTSIPDRLAEELLRVREDGLIAFGSGTTDPYQPTECQNRITQSSARILAEWSERASVAAGRDLFEKTTSEHPHLPAIVLTKSASIIEDLPLWKRINDHSGVVLLVSITSLDEELRKTMEPGASSFTDRLATLRAFKEAGCSVGALAMPFLPGLSDNLESIRALYAALAAIPVDFIMPGGLTLRPGRQKDLYLSVIESQYPEQYRQTVSRYREDRPSGMPIHAASDELSRRVAAVQAEWNTPFLLPHRIYRRLLPLHDAYRVLLRDMIDLYRARAVDTNSLEKSANRYDAWLSEERRYFRRHRSLSTMWLRESLPRALESGVLAQVLDNEKLLHFSHQIIRDQAVLNYRTLKLEG